MREFFRGKVFAGICLGLGLVAIAFITMQNVMWEEYLLPQYPTATLNNISGANFFAYFTVLTNTFCTAWLILYAIGRFGVPKLANFLTKPIFQGALTVYIFIVGFLYWGVMVWFIDFYPSDLWMFNIIDVFQHLIIPLTFVLMWLVGMTDERADKKYVPFYLVYPLIYFVFSIVRGGIIDWYPYPFFSAPGIWETLFGDKAYNAAAAYTIVVVICAVLVVVIFVLGRVALNINNKRVDKLVSK